MRALTKEELDLIAGGDGTTVAPVPVTGTPPTPPWYPPTGWEAPPYEPPPGDGGGGDSGGGGDGGGGDEDILMVVYPSCVEAYPAGVDPAKVMLVAKQVAGLIASEMDQTVEYGYLIYELNGVVDYGTRYTQNLPDEVNIGILGVPAGAKIIGYIHNHPDQNYVVDAVPSHDDWTRYNSFMNSTLPNGITIDPNALLILYTDEDGKTRIYDKTDKNQTNPSCAI